ncbi:junctional adhesion molecule-like isoform X1 [Rousettus aegyptiacus]|uniref:Junctional adhesion molecule-like n=2 Tax=Rousettus aegyptiacus TaxID=9407 RepID=A0A7J8H173_ROUAE|nr:junctional adhesion molecule-like isoform X1 [Rousettus aegyptiacus]XP_016010972.1 junctional adhesion molecule-like isoform X1 [Rousettus aegyptiacus]KAF6465579.1 junction adhesion molecule like [Rousettus aegyptiacus]
MFYPLKLILMTLLLDYSLGLNDLIVSSLELTVHVGDSALMGCVFQSTEVKRVTKVDWTFSSGEHAKDDYVLYYYANLSVPVGRFKNRAYLVGDILRNDGSLLLQNVEETDQGSFTCEIRLEMESVVLKKAVVLHVLPEEPKEFTVYVGDSTYMGCVFQSTEEKHMTKVDWTFSSGEHAKEEIVLHYYPKLGVPVGYLQNWGRFQNRVTLVGDLARNDGSIMLNGVKEFDGGSYTCSIHLGNLTFKKTIVLHVIQKESQTLVTPATHRPEILGGNQLVIIVGIVCATILLLPVLVLIVKRTNRNKSSVTSTALVKSLEDTKKAHPEKHVYSSITTREVTEEEKSSEKSEATYMTMHPVWPSQVNTK